MYASLPVPAKVVLHLAAPYLDKGHHFFADRYYSSIPLVQALEDRSSEFSGTVMRNRVGLPHLIRTESSSLRAGESMEYRCGRLLAVSWRDKSAKQPVTILTSSCSAAKVTVATRRGESQVKPIAVDTYNQSMNGVDRSDQFTVYYSFVRRTRKWWRKLFFYLLEVSTVNAYILYRATVESPLSHLEFRRSVLEDLAMGYIENSTRPTVGRRRIRPAPLRLDKRQHFIAQHRMQCQCVVCSDTKRGIRVTTTYFCETCPDMPSLHPGGCFKRYHTMEHFKIQHEE